MFICLFFYRCRKGIVGGVRAPSIVIRGRARGFCRPTLTPVRRLFAGRCARRMDGYRESHDMFSANLNSHRFVHSCIHPSLRFQLSQSPTQRERERLGSVQGGGGGDGARGSGGINK